MKHRIERINSLIQEELAKILVREMNFHEALVTITEVECSDELDYATVRVSVIPSERAEPALKMLVKATPHLQYLLLRKMNIKPMPKIHFQIDHGPEKAAEMEKIMKGIEIEEE